MIRLGSFFCFPLPLVVLALAGLVSLALACDVHAQAEPAPPPLTPPIKEQIGAWQFRCEARPGAPEPICLISQSVVAEDRPGVGLEITILKAVDEKNPLMRVAGPIAILIARGLTLTVDDKEIGVAPFLRCLPDSCIANIDADERLIKLFSEAKKAFFTIYFTPEVGIGMPFSLERFSEAFAKLDQKPKTP